jgi:hypothetical protein
MYVKVRNYLYHKKKKKKFILFLFFYYMSTQEKGVGVPMRAVNNRPPTANRYNRQPSNRLTALTANRYNR